jgi:succinoglycan biosynthesis protein ExoA
LTPLVSVIIPCRNEARSINRCMDSVLASDYPPGRLEVIVADGMSHDRTRQQVESYASRDARVRCIDNPGLTAPQALNRAIAAARGDLILRLDAHAGIAADYIGRAVDSLERYGADCVGGAMRTRTHFSGIFAEPIRVGLSHFFGVGNSHFRTGPDGPRWVDTVYGACWRREVFDRVGWFNEDLVRSQDIEFSSRLRRAGGRILVSPEMHIDYYVRGTLGAFWRQNWTNGMWAVLPFVFSEGIAVRWRHLAPLGLLVSLAISAAAGLGIFVAAPYIALNLAASAHAAWKERRPALVLRMPVVFASLHVAYGMGSVWGCARLSASLFRQGLVKRTATEVAE